MRALNALHDEMAANAACLSAVTPIMRGDGVAFTSVVHPRGRKKVPADINPAAIETIPAPPSVVAEIERLGPKKIAKRKAAKKKRTKAETLALVEAEAARKRALKTARQTRWRNKQRKKAKKK